MVRSYGDYSTNVPLQDLLNHQAWIAFRFDGKDLAPEHGGPARLLVPHLYLWKSAKWVRSITLMDEVSPAGTDGHLTTEKIIKSWVRESHDRRHGLVNQRHRVNVHEQIAAPLGDPHVIARAQLVRFRQRLGTLTRDQELQIESLLISTVTQVSLMTRRLMESMARET